MSDKTRLLRKQLKALIDDYGADVVDAQLHKLEPFKSQDRESAKISREYFAKLHKRDFITHSTKERFLKASTGWGLTISLPPYSPKLTVTDFTGFMHGDGCKNREFITDISKVDEVLNFFYENGWVREEENPVFQGLYNGNYIRLNHPQRKEEWLSKLPKNSISFDWEEVKANPMEYGFTPEEAEQLHAPY